MARRCGGVDWAAYRRYMIRRRYSRQTISARWCNARDWVAWCGDDWRQATFEDVEDWVASRAISPAASRNLVVYLRAFYRWAGRTGVAADDPTRLIEPWRLPRRLPRPAPEGEIRALLGAGDAELAAMVALMAGAGLRCVECSRLDWADVDLIGGRVRVIGKGDRERVIDVSDDVRARLSALDTTVGPVFVGPTGARLSPARVSQRVARAAAGLGLDVRAHRLRHRCATVALAQSGADLLAVRDLLGHSTVATTQIYTALVPGKVSAMSRQVTLP